jgi:hypothetical protein
MFQYLFSLADKKGSSSKEIPQIQHHPPENGLPQYPHLVDTLDDRVTEMQISTWQTLHLKPATSFGGALSPPPKSHPLGSQGKMALQNSEPTKWAKCHSVWAQKVVVLDCQFLNPVSKWRPSLIAEDDEITFTFEGWGFRVWEKLDLVSEN